MINGFFLFLVVCVVCALVIAFGWFIIHRKRRQQKENEQTFSESLLCADCRAELKPVNGNPDLYECPSCSQSGNLVKGVGPKWRL